MLRIGDRVRIRGVSVDIGGATWAADEIASLAQDLRRGIELAAAEVQAVLRAQVKAAGLGEGLEKAWSTQTYPRRRSNTLGPAAIVYSKATLLHAVFNEGPTIGPRGGRYLAVPTKEAEALGLTTTNLQRQNALGFRNGTGAIPRRQSMLDRAEAKLGKKNIVLLRGRSGRILVAYRQRRRDDPIILFVLVPQVKLGKVLDLDAAFGQADLILPASLAAQVNRPGR